MSWTDERIEQLRNMWEKGLTASQIADELGGVSRNAVIGKLSRLGLTRDKPPGGDCPPRKPRERRGRSVPRLQYEMLRQVYDEAAFKIGRAHV